MKLLGEMNNTGSVSKKHSCHYYESICLVWLSDKPRRYMDRLWEQN